MTKYFLLKALAFVSVVCAAERPPLPPGPPSDPHNLAKLRAETMCKAAVGKLIRRGYHKAEVEIEHVAKAADADQVRKELNDKFRLLWNDEKTLTDCILKKHIGQPAPRARTADALPATPVGTGSSR